MAEMKGGDKFRALLKDLGQKLNKKRVLRVGFLPGQTYPDGTPVATIAAIQDSGAPSKGIPPRPFFRNMIRENQESWPGAMEELLKANNYDVVKSLNILGQGMEDALKLSIAELLTPVLKPATIEGRLRRGKTKRSKQLLKRFRSGKGIPMSVTKPLVDTGVLIASPRHEVK